jgi:chemotaxis protein MotB
MAAGKDQSIVIKKIKKVSGGHHGGAWKVAYADFVTAMMAFFLLLWLLSSTSDAQKQGIADYFTPTMGLKDEAGIGFKGGTSEEMEGTKKSDKSTIAIVASGQPAGVGTQKKESLIEADMEQAEFEKTREDIQKAMEDDPSMSELAQNLLIKVTPEGLQVDVIDSDEHPMFEPGSPVISAFGQTILAKLAKIVERLPNYISISGHTDAEVLKAKGGSYTNWELSADRANAARRYMTLKGLPEERISKIQGRGAFEPLFPDDPLSPRNRRISMVLLRGEHMAQSSYMQNRPGSLISTPKIDEGLLKKREPVKGQPSEP